MFHRYIQSKSVDSANFWRKQLHWEWEELHSHDFSVYNKFVFHSYIYLYVQYHHITYSTFLCSSIDEKSECKDWKGHCIGKFILILRIHMCLFNSSLQWKTINETKIWYFSIYLNSIGRSDEPFLLANVIFSLFCSSANSSSWQPKLWQMH